MHKTAFFNDVVGCSPRRQGRPMRRREFITLLGGAAAWGSPAGAQEPRRVIGFLSGASSDSYSGVLAAFVQRLKDTGFIEGNNISIEWRWAEGQYDRLPSLAGELVSRGVAVIVAFDAPAASAAKAATKTIPIVFVTGADPVKTGLVDSLSRPGGNLTGVSTLISMLGPKRLEVLRELFPSTSTFALLINPSNPNVVDAPETEVAGHSLRSGFLTSAAARGASIFKMADQSRHKSMDTLRGYVRDAEIFKDHAGMGLL
jgi:putative ABC transport system substrate-binding protein